MILPERVFGSSSVNRIVFGLAIGPMSCATWFAQLLDELVAGLDAAAQGHERGDRLTGGVVVASDDRGLGHRRDGRPARTRPRWSRCCDPTTSMMSSTRPSSQK